MFSTAFQKRAETMLLLTAFEPFDGTGLNSSQEALRLFSQRHPQGFDATPFATATLPVVYEADVTALRRVRLEMQAPPRAILHLGQTSARTVDVERIAVNLKLLDFEEARGHGQNHENQDRNRGPRHGRICAQAPPALFSTLPVEAVLDALRQAGVPCRDSAHAGTYLCNHILFRSLHEAAIREATTPNARHQAAPLIGFVHLPRLPQQVARTAGGENAASLPALPLETLLRAVEIAVAVVAARL